VAKGQIILALHFQQTADRAVEHEPAFVVAAGMGVV
jgi:hypothetical protein